MLGCLVINLSMSGDGCIFNVSRITAHDPMSFFHAGFGDGVCHEGLRCSISFTGATGELSVELELS